MGKVKYILETTSLFFICNIVVTSLFLLNIVPYPITIIKNDPEGTTDLDPIVPDPDPIDPPINNIAKRISYFSFNNSLEDLYGRAQASEYPLGNPEDIVTFVEGYRGSAIRSSHNNTDDGGGDFEISHYSQGWPESREIYISYHLKLEENYSTPPDGTIHNFKQFWSYGETGHIELVMYYLQETEFSFIWQLSGDAGWDAGTDINKYSPLIPLTRDEWMHFEIYIKLSSGVNGQYADGIFSFKIDDKLIFYGNDN